jgi:hypothetical protein
MKKEIYKKQDFTPRMEFLKAMKADFEVQYGSYSSFIIYDNTKEIYCSEFMPKDCFYANNKMKSDLLKHDISNILKHDRRENVWYNNSSMIEDWHEAHIYNIDLNSAYLQALNNTGFLSKETFKYCSQISKPSRLKSIGLFASRKEKYQFVKGVVTDKNPEVIQGKLANVYFYTAFQVDLIMGQAAKMLKGAFVFFWFDGIYFVSPYIIEDWQKSENRFITELFNDYNFPHKICELKDFTIKRNEDFINVKYEKDGKDISFSFVDKVINNIINLQIKKSIYV